MHRHVVYNKHIDRQRKRDVNAQEIPMTFFDGLFFVRSPYPSLIDVHGRLNSIRVIELMSFSRYCIASVKNNERYFIILKLHF